MTHSDPKDFKGTNRFVIRRRLGAGGFGTVYEAYDCERNTTVALKALREANADGIYRFKREFRAFADVAHPNLVTLYELIFDGDKWFLTMELIDGCNFVDYVQGQNDSENVNSTFETVRLTNSISNSSDPERITARLTVTPQVDIQRLRDALTQLIEGINVLHASGILHRDIKPMNVLVTPEGRVVLLDFGLITDVVTREPEQSLILIGTPNYMSPEQGAGLPITEASDWYAVGVMLYEALTGQLPFKGRHFEVLKDKQALDPTPPISLAPNIPEDLNSLCVDLLRRDPQARPSGHEVLLRLGKLQVSEERPKLAAPSIRHRAAFIGREKHLDELTTAFIASKNGRPVTVYVQGKSGIGKSALVHRFLDDLQRREKDAVILASRCYEQESVPYKAIDGVVDALSKYLKHLPSATCELLLPHDVLALARLFPVLRQVEVVAGARRRVVEISDSRELRRRAFSAFRELLARLADQKYLVLFIDDLQWGDADSMALLGDFLRPPDPPALLLIASYRCEDVETSPPLQNLFALRDSLTPDIEPREIVVEELTSLEAQDLALTLLRDAPVSMNAEAIARESGASPFFIHELVRYLVAGRELVPSDTQGTEPYAFKSVDDTKLSEVIWARVAQLPKQARRLLEVVSVAGRPIPLDVAKLAAKLETIPQQALAILRSDHLIRIKESRHQDEIETYHDRIRETVIAHLLPEALKAYHYQLALSLESLGQTDLEAMAIHFKDAGHLDQAVRYAIAAADRASEALAFDRASRLYHLALKLEPRHDTGQCNLLVKLASVLANAGRPAESARFYLDATQGADSTRSLDLQRRAAEQLLMGGHIDEGLDVIRKVLAAVGLRLFSNPKRALLSLLLRRARLRLRGLNFTERQESEISKSDLLRIDICWAVAAGLGSVDAIRGADFQTLHLLLALQAGEPYRIARAMAIEAGFSALPGRHGQKRSAQLVRSAEVLAQKAHNPHATGLALVMAGIAAFLVGHWRKAADLCRRAEVILRNQCIGAAWELASAHRFLLSSLMYLGELREMADRLPNLISEAKERGNLYAATSLRSRMHIVWLAANDAERARRENVEALAEWTPKGFYIQHFYGLFALIQVELYSGRGHLAWKEIEEQWPALTNSMLLRIQVLRVESMHLKARCALAMAVADKNSERLLILAQNLAKKIAKEKVSWSEPLSLLTQAGIAAIRGSQSLAADLLASAAVDFDAADMNLYAAAARRCLGRVIGGDYGDELITVVDAWMLDQKILNPAFMTRMLAPGFPGDV
ncbi:MAG TPA: protein kinase [Pyrinomonadaceae bacterium]